MVLCVARLGDVHLLLGSLLGFGNQGVDPQLGFHRGSEGWRCPESRGQAAEGKSELVGFLCVGWETFKGDVLSQSWLQRAFGPGLLSSSSVLRGLLFPRTGLRVF